MMVSCHGLKPPDAKAVDKVKYGKCLEIQNRLVDIWVVSGLRFRMRGSTRAYSEEEKNLWQQQLRKRNRERFLNKKAVQHCLRIYNNEYYACTISRKFVSSTQWAYLCKPLVGGQ